MKLFSIAALLHAASALIVTPSRAFRSSTHVPKMLFESSKGLPPLYDGWFAKSRYIEKSIVGAVKAGSRIAAPCEVLFPCVPNLDEVQYGTVLNQAFGKEVALDLGMPEYKPGSKIKTYLIQFSNVYWAKRLAEGLSGTTYGVFTDGLKKDDVTKPGKLKIASINKPETYADVKKGDTVIVMSPNSQELWKTCSKIFQEQKVNDSAGYAFDLDRTDIRQDNYCAEQSLILRTLHGTCTQIQLVFMNAALTTTYDLGGPLDGLTQAYYVKRVSKGWAFVCAPGKWRAYLEKPDGSTELIKEYPAKPSLKQLATEVREESLKRYGIFNDRFAPGFGGRL